MYKRLLPLLLFLLFLGTTEQLFAQRADGHAPIGVMGEHLHRKGELMVSYRYMRMDMDGNRDGTESLSNSEILDPAGPYNYMITPTSMPMNMHMFGAMYAISDHVTLTAMVPFLSSEMDHVTRAGGEFTTESGGLGDIKVSALFGITKTETGQLLGQVGISLPTGSIDESDVTPASAPNETTLPYPMQIGSGTFDLMPALTYRAFIDDLSYGAQARGTLRIGENEQDYALGNVLDTNLWFGYNVVPWFSPEIRLRGLLFGDIDGEDPRFAGALANNVIHTVDPLLKDGFRTDMGIGLNFLVPDGNLKSFRFSLEYDFPIYQDLGGPQMETDGIFTMGIMYTFFQKGHQ